MKKNPHFLLASLISMVLVFGLSVQFVFAQVTEDYVIPTLGNSQPTGADLPEQVEIDPEEVVLPGEAEGKTMEIVVDLNVYETKVLNQDNHNMEVSFLLQNGVGAQTGVSYLVQVVGDNKEGVKEMLYEKVYEEKINFLENTYIERTVDFQAPSYLDGEFEIWVKAANDESLVLGLNLAATVEFEALTEQSVFIDSKTCRLAIEGVEDFFTVDQGVDISSEEELSLVCDIENLGDQVIQLNPDWQVFRRDVYGQKLNEKNKNKPFSLTANEKREMTFSVPKPSLAQAYGAVFSLTRGSERSNEIRVKFVVQGDSATISNLQLDKGYYKRGDEATVSVFWAMAADSFFGSRSGIPETSEDVFYSLLMRDNDGLECIEPVRNLSLKRDIATSKIKVDITNDCLRPQVFFAMEDESGKVISSKEFNFEASPDLKRRSGEPIYEDIKKSSSAVGKTIKKSEKKTKTKDTKLLLVFLAILILILVLLLLSSKRGHISVFIFAIFASFMFAGQADAALVSSSIALERFAHFGGGAVTDTYNCTVNLNHWMINPNSTMTGWVSNCNIHSCGNAMRLVVAHDTNKNFVNDGDPVMYDGNTTSIVSGNWSIYHWRTWDSQVFSPTTFTTPAASGPQHSRFFMDFYHMTLGGCGNQYFWHSPVGVSGAQCNLGDTWFRVNSIGDVAYVTNTPPDVTITSPSYDQYFTVGDNITFNGNYSDANGHAMDQATWVHRTLPNDLAAVYGADEVTVTPTIPKSRNDLPLGSHVAYLSVRDSMLLDSTGYDRVQFHIVNPPSCSLNFDQANLTQGQAGTFDLVTFNTFGQADCNFVSPNMISAGNDLSHSGSMSLGNNFGQCTVYNQAGRSATCNASYNVVEMASCGADNGGSFAAAPSNLCGPSSSDTGFVATGPGWDWSCENAAGASVPCSASRVNPPSCSFTYNEATLSSGVGGTFNLTLNDDDDGQADCDCYATPQTAGNNQPHPGSASVGVNNCECTVQNIAGTATCSSSYNVVAEPTCTFDFVDSSVLVGATISVYDLSLSGDSDGQADCVCSGLGAGNYTLSPGSGNSAFPATSFSGPGNRDCTCTVDNGFGSTASCQDDIDAVDGTLAVNIDSMVASPNCYDSVSPAVIDVSVSVDPSSTAIGTDEFSYRCDGAGWSTFDSANSTFSCSETSTGSKTIDVRGRRGLLESAIVSQNINIPVCTSRPVASFTMVPNADHDTANSITSAHNGKLNTYFELDAGASSDSDGDAFTAYEWSWGNISGPTAVFDTGMNVVRNEKLTTVGDNYVWLRVEAGGEWSDPVMQMANIQTPSFNFYADNNIVAAGANLDLRWQPENLTWCSASGPNPWNTLKASENRSSPAYHQELINMTSTGSYSYDLDCGVVDDIYPLAGQSVNIEVIDLDFDINGNTSDFGVGLGTPLNLNWTASSNSGMSCTASGPSFAGPRPWQGTVVDNPGATGNYTYEIYCTKGAVNTATKSITVSVVNGVDVDFDPSPAYIPSGTNIDIGWDTVSAINCSGTGGLGGWSSAVLGTGVNQSWSGPAANLASDGTSFTIDCDDGGALSDTDTVVLRVMDLTFEGNGGSASPSIFEGEDLNLSWSGTNIDTCVAGWDASLGYSDFGDTITGLSAGSHNYVLECSNSSDASYTITSTVQVTVSSCTTDCVNNGIPDTINCSGSESCTGCATGADCQALTKSRQLKNEVDCHGNVIGVCSPVYDDSTCNCSGPGSINWNEVRPGN